jgi:hypothetical protein
VADRLWPLPVSENILTWFIANDSFLHNADELKNAHQTPEVRTELSIFRL